MSLGGLYLEGLIFRILRYNCLVFMVTKILILIIFYKMLLDLLFQQVVLFYHKLREILEGCKECKGRYELVLISGEVEDEIADVLVPMLQ